MPRTVWVVFGLFILFTIIFATQNAIEEREHDRKGT